MGKKRTFTVTIGTATALAVGLAIGVAAGAIAGVITAHTITAETAAPSMPVRAHRPSPRPVAKHGASNRDFVGPRGPLHGGPR